MTITKTHNCGCGAPISLWLCACKPCYRRVPQHVRDAYHDEWQICKANRIAHTDKLLALRAQIHTTLQKKEAA